jgi:alpha-tubulin suppressor-like RCC1 family protein
MKRANALFFVLFACSGNDATIDGGTDAATGNDVTPEYYVKETAPPSPTFVDLTAGAQHTCVIVAYGVQHATYCFGAAAALGATTNGILAVASAGLATSTSPNFLQIGSSHGANHTCAIDDQKQVFCWGDNTLGQCGTGTTSPNVATPTVSFDSQVGIIQAASLAIGSTASCVVRATGGKLGCFGDNGKCQTDLWDSGGCSASAYAAVDTTDTDVVFKNVTSAAIGAIHGCVAADPAGGGSAALFCFGDNASLESAPAGKAITAPAIAITTPAKVISIATGDAHTCFVTDSPHQLFCFGMNDQHQASPTSNSATIDPSAATPITLPKTGLPNMVFARAAETCVVDTDGLLFCFGSTHGTNIDEITGVKDVGRVALGGGHTCIIGHLPSDSVSAPGSLLCWGDNTNGQVGQTAGGTVSTPTAVVIPDSAPAQ